MDEQFDSETVDTILAFWEREHPGNDHVFMAQQYRTLAARLAAAEADRDTLNLALHEASERLLTAAKLLADREQRLTAAEARINRSEFSVRLQSQRLYGQGFAAYVNGSATEGTAVIIADLHAILESCVDSDESWKRITSESCVHELLHVFQEILGREFSDAEVEAAIEAARRDKSWRT